MLYLTLIRRVTPTRAYSIAYLPQRRIQLYLYYLRVLGEPASRLYITVFHDGELVSILEKTGLRRTVSFKPAIRDHVYITVSPHPVHSPVGLWKIVNQPRLVVVSAREIELYKRHAGHYFKGQVKAYVLEDKELKETVARTYFKAKGIVVKPPSHTIAVAVS